MSQDQQSAITGRWMARWLPLACFSVAVGSTLSVLVLQAMTPSDGPTFTFAHLPKYVAGWLCFAAMLVVGTVAAIFRVDVLEAKHFHNTSVQDVTLLLMGTIIVVTLVILLANDNGWLWISTSMAMATAGLIPLLVVRLRKSS